MPHPALKDVLDLDRAGAFLFALVVLRFEDAHVLEVAGTSRCSFGRDEIRSRHDEERSASREAKHANTLCRLQIGRRLSELGPVLKRQLGELDEQRHPLLQGKRLEPARLLLFRFQASIVADERFHGWILPRSPGRFA